MYIYWWKIFKKSFFTSVYQIKDRFIGAIITFIAIFISGFIYNFLWPDTWLDKIREGFVGGSLQSLSLLIIIFLLILICNFISLPPKLDSGLRNKIRNINKNNEIQKIQNRFIPLSKALDIIITHFKSDYNSISNHDDKQIRAINALRQAAADGKIVICGHKEIERIMPFDKCDSIPVNIEKDYWIEHEFDHVVIFDQNDKFRKPATLPIRSYGPFAGQKANYFNLTVKEAEIRKLWPVMG